MNELYTLLEKGSDMDPNGDGEYNGSEMGNLLRELREGFLDICYPAEELAQEMLADFDKPDTTTTDTGHTCTECGKILLVPIQIPSQEKRNTTVKLTIRKSSI